MWEFERFGLCQVAVDLFSQRNIVEDIVDDFRVVKDVGDLVFPVLDKKISQVLEGRKLIASNSNLIKSNAAMIEKEILGEIVA